jgi:hypothetical protein
VADVWWITGPLPPAKYQIQVVATDSAGGCAVSAAVGVNKDATTPVVASGASCPAAALGASITSPANGARVHGNVKVTATATDAASGVAQVSFYVDGVLIGTSKGPSYSVTWNTNKVSKAQHTLTAIAQDVAGNSQTSSGVLVTVT